jgi:hypothetical protein
MRRVPNERFGLNAPWSVVFGSRSGGCIQALRACLLITGLLACGCSESPPRELPVAVAPQPLPTLDEAFAKYSNAMVHAWQELPTDKWEDKPFRSNVSAEERVSVIARPMFEEIKAQLKGMTVTNLVRAFKLVEYPYGEVTNEFGWAAEYAYAIGNQLIKNEIKTRPPEELRGLPKLGSDKYMLVEGPQGFGAPLTYDLQEILDDLGLTNRWNR